MRFIDYLIRNNIDNKLYSLAFFVAVISYSCWQPIEGAFEFSEEHEGLVFFIGIAFSFSCYASAYMFSKWDKWRWFPMFVSLICVSRLLRELYFIYDPTSDPTKYNAFDYIDFLITIFIVFNYYIKYRYKKYKEDETNKELQQK